MNEQTFGDDIDAGDEVGPLIKTPDTEQVKSFLTAWRRLGLGGIQGRFTDPGGRDGLTGPILPGPMSLAFLSQMLTDWAGPAGQVRVLEVNYRRPTRHGEELKCIGLITDTREEGDETIVKLDVYIEDPRGDRPTQGVAEVVIPTSRT